MKIVFSLRTVMISCVLLTVLLVPTQSQLLDDVKDPQGVLDHFRSRIKQASSYPTL